MLFCWCPFYSKKNGTDCNLSHEELMEDVDSILSGLPPKHYEFVLALLTKLVAKLS